jgi:hypothetical protein
MDEEKRSESSGEKPERLGPYVLQEQVEQDHDSPVELYLATHETSGATALVRKHAAEEGGAPGKDWRVRLGSSSEGYSAMEVEHTDLATSGWLLDTSDAGESVVARPLPRGPFKGQKRPPCIRYTEVELVGGCWMQHVLMAPCPDELYEYQGKCYAPTFSAKPPPSSLGQ